MPITTPVMPDMPTAEELSGSTNLADYMAEQFDAQGYAELPPGVITISDTIPWHRTMAGRLIGAGRSTIPTYHTTSWRNPAEASDWSTTIKQLDPTKPIFDFDAAQSSYIGHLLLESGGDMITYRTTVTGWPSNGLLLENVCFHKDTSGYENQPTAFVAGQDINTSNAADVEFRGCYFRYVNGLRVKHQQGVNYHFSGRTWVEGSDKFIFLEQGGCVVADFLSGHSVKTWFTSVGGGGNVRTNKLGFVYSDRAANYPPAVIVDLSQQGGVSSAVIVDAVKMTYHTGDATNWPNRHAYLLPSNHAATLAKIIVNNIDAHTYTPGTSSTPTIASNPFDI